MSNWENKFSSQGIHYSRYIASFNKELIKYISAGNKYERFGYREDILNWLTKYCEVSEEEAVEIANLAEDGKLELEGSAMMAFKRYSVDKDP
jgi:hypothetical protein